MKGFSLKVAVVIIFVTLVAVSLSLSVQVAMARMSQEPVKQELSMSGTLSVIGFLEPWEPWMDSEVRVEARDRCTEKEIVEAVYPEEVGAFTLKFELTAEVKEIFHSGNIEIRALDRTGKVLGNIRIAPYKDEDSIAVKLRIMHPTSGQVSKPPLITSNDIITKSVLQHLAEKLARLQGVDVRNARVPLSIMKVIKEINEISQFSARSLAGDKDAEESLRRVLSAFPFTSPGGAPGVLGRIEDMSKMGLIDALGELQPVRGCGPILQRTAKVLEGAFRLDFKERNQDARWTRQARAYVRDRMQDISFYNDLADRAFREFEGPFGVFPGDDGLTTFILPPGPPKGFPPEPEPGPDDGFEPSPCEQINDLCLGLYGEVLAAQLRDEFTDLIASVEPNCLCSNYDPNQVLVARPQPGRFFPITIPPKPQIPPTLPTGVLLYFGDQVITPISVQPTEIRFRIPSKKPPKPQIPPTKAHTGPVYLRALGSLPSEASRRLADTCGLAMPELPAEILMDRSPAAAVSIIYPPVIDFFRSSVHRAEACTPVEISWRVHLIDRPVDAPIPPCGSIEVTIRDEQGNQVAKGGSSGSVLETRSDTTTYTIGAVSQANQVHCGTAAPVSLTVERVKKLWLVQSPTGTDLRGGTSGTFTVRVSCPAPMGGIPVEITSSIPSVLQVQSPVIIQEGQTSLAVDFRTTAACMPVEVTASAADHIFQGPIRYEIYDQPSLSWASGITPNIQEQDAYTFRVIGGCVPQNNVQWLLQKVNNGNQQSHRISQTTSTGQYPEITFQVSLSERDATAYLTPGNWELYAVIPERDFIQSTGLPFIVTARPHFEINVQPTEQTVEWGGQADYRLTLTGHNILNKLNVNLSTDLPDGKGVNHDFGPRDVELNPEPDNTGYSTLTVRNKEGVASLGETGFNIIASDTNFTRSVPASLVIKRKYGLFDRVTLHHYGDSSQSCGSITATIGGDRNTPTVLFHITTGSISSSPSPVLYYAISPRCRVGIVIPPWKNDPAYDPAVSLYNLGFSMPNGPHGLGNEIKLITQMFWQQFWCSRDDSLLVIIGRTINGTSADTHFAYLFNTVTGNEIDNETFMPEIIEGVNGADPENPDVLLPPQPDDVVTKLCDIESIELTKNTRNNDVVRVRYKDGQFDLEMR